MNVIVRADGTAELDDRGVSFAARDALRSKAWLTVPLTVDGDRVGQALYLPAGPTFDPPRNLTAQAMVADLTGVHIWFGGTVVLADLDADTAHRLLEELKQNGA